MWLLFSRSFEKHLITVLGYDAETAHTVAAKAIEEDICCLSF